MGYSYRTGITNVLWCRTKGFLFYFGRVWDVIPFWLFVFLMSSLFMYKTCVVPLIVLKVQLHSFFQ